MLARLRRELRFPHALLLPMAAGFAWWADPLVPGDPLGRVTLAGTLVVAALAGLRRVPLPPLRNAFPVALGTFVLALAHGGVTAGTVPVFEFALGCLLVGIAAVGATGVVDGRYALAAVGVAGLAGWAVRHATGRAALPTFVVLGVAVVSLGRAAYRVSRRR